MVANAYIFLKVEPARTSEVVQRLKSLPGAVVREVLGPYDVVVELERDTVVDITSVMRSKIRTVPGVQTTTTCMWVEGSFGHGAGGE